MTPMALAIVAAVAMATPAGPTSVQTDSAGQSLASDPALLEPFLRELQRAVAADNRKAVAALVEYPITVFIGGVRVPMRDAAALTEHYDQIFTAELKRIIAGAVVPGRGRPGPAYAIDATPDGFSIAAVISIRRTPAAPRITQITVPRLVPGTASAGSPVAPAASRSIRSRPAEPRRLVFRAGQRSTQFSGTLGPEETDSYVVWAPKGQLIEVRIDGVRGRDIVARLLDQKGETPIDGRTGAGVRTWTGRVPASADYRIDVQRVTPTGDAALPYRLVVTLR
jgi:hypothetical protein